MKRVLIILAFAFAFAGCRTYESPFVHKSSSELDLMETRDQDAATAFRQNDLAKARSINDELTKELTVSSPLYDLERVSLLTIAGEKEAAHATMTNFVSNLDLLYDPASEEEAISLWHGENSKVFMGDNHERATLYALLAMSAIERGEYEDAIRCVKNGLLADTSSDPKESYSSDYALLDYLGYVAASYQGDQSVAAEYKTKMRAALGERGFDVEDKKRTWAHLADDSRPLPNAFIIAWTGTSPEFLRGGEYHEIRHIIPGKDDVQAVTLEVGRGEITAVNGLADINFQATTRGKRVMDEVLEDKAKIKTGFQASGNILLVGGMACFLAASQTSDGRAKTVLAIVGGACVATGATFYIVGACMNPDADVRAWKCLPANFRVIPVHLQPGHRSLKVNAYIGWDRVASKTIELDVPEKGAVFAHVPFVNLENTTKKDEIISKTIMSVWKSGRSAYEIK